MRELSLTQNLLETVIETVGRNRVVSIELLIGPFSADREENIRFYWRDLAKGTAGEGAQLHFRHMQVDMKCLACGGAFFAEDEESICRYCHGDNMQSPGIEVKLERIVMK